MLLKIAYVLTCRLLSLAVLAFRGDLAKYAELLALRHENAVLRRHAGPGAVRAGRPGLVRRARTAHPAQALGRGLPRYASDAAGLAPQAGGGEVRHEQAAQAGTPAGKPGHRPPHRSPGEGESSVGTPPHSWRAREARRGSRAVDRVEDPSCRGH